MEPPAPVAPPALGVVAPPPALDPPLPVVPKGVRVRHSEVFVPGGKLTFTGKSLDAHCHCEAHKHRLECKLDRTVVPRRVVANSIAGRPLGFLLAWLQYGADCPDRDTHTREAGKYVSAAGKFALRWEKRAELRAWAMTQPWYNLITERAKAPDEPDEPGKPTEGE